MTAPHRSELTKLFGEIADGKWPDESKHMGLLVVPDWAAEKLITTFNGKQTRRIYMNRAAHMPFLNAIGRILAAKLEGELKTFDGCFQIRNVRGVIGVYSTHSWGLGIDLNAAENALGAVPMLSQDFVNCFKAEGWIWGGDFSRCDGMHFQFCQE